MTRDAEMTASDFVALVLRGIGAETDITAVERFPTYAQLVVNYYSDPAHRDELRALWEHGMRDLLDVGRAGLRPPARPSCGPSPRRRAPTRGSTWSRASSTGPPRSTGSASTPTCAGRCSPAWPAAAARRRTASTRSSRRDNTISGQEQAALARTVRPTAEAKAEAWRDAIERDDVANETMRQIAYAFPTAGQEELLAPYLEKYLAMAETVWEEKGTQRASTALEYMFLRPLTSAATLARIDAWLEASAANPAAKRYVREGRSDMARALAAQAKDAATR